MDFISKQIVLQSIKSKSKKIELFFANFTLKGFNYSINKRYFCPQFKKNKNGN